MNATDATKPILTREELIQDIQKHLPGNSLEQAQRFAMQIERLGKVKTYLNTYSDDKKIFENEGLKEQDMLDRAEKELKYTEPYRIAIIGRMGSGKSSLLNALLQRDLSLPGIAKATTDAVLEITMDIKDGEKEYAEDVPPLNDELLQYGSLFSKNYGVNIQLTQLNPNSPEFRSKFRETIEGLDLTSLKGTTSQKEVESLRNALMITLAQSTEENKRFDLSKESDRTELDNLISVSADASKDRIHTVCYHIQPPRAEESDSLRLPSNVRLVDLPGLSGKPFHNIIIRHYVDKKAHAVVFVTMPRRIVPEIEHFSSDIRKYIFHEKSQHDRLFLVINAWDDVRANLDDVHTILKETDRCLDAQLHGYAHAENIQKRGGKIGDKERCYFCASAKLAAYAREALQKNGAIKNQTEYNTIAERYGHKNDVNHLLSKEDHETLLQESHIPLLTEKLSEFFQQSLVENQILVGQKSVDQIVDPLIRTHEGDKKALEERIHPSKVKKHLKDEFLRREKLAQELLRESASSHLDDVADNFQNNIANDVSRITNAIYQEALAAKLPEFYHEANNMRENPLNFRKETAFMNKIFLAQVDFFLQEKMTMTVPELGPVLFKKLKAHVNSELFKKFNELAFATQTPLNVKIQDEFTSLTGRMQDALTKASERLAIIYMLEEKNQLRALPLEAANGKQKDEKEMNDNEKIVMMLKNSQKMDFKVMTSHIQTHYKKVFDEIENALRNIYLYEINRLYHALQDVIITLFEDQLQRSYSDEEFKLIVLENSFLKEDFSRVKLLREKLEALKECR